MKGRAEWRPFGVILREQDQAEFLECSQYSPFMLFTYPVRKPWRERVPAAVHKDGTTRPQMLNERNPLLMDIVESFEKVTGISMVINTSFNRGGEPIVCSPADAIDSFSGLGADHMLMGPYWVSAESSLQQATAKSV